MLCALKSVGDAMLLIASRSAFAITGTHSENINAQVHSIDSCIPSTARLMMILICLLKLFLKWCILESKTRRNNLITIKSNSHLEEWYQLCVYSPMKQPPNCGRYIKRCTIKL